MYHYEPVDSTLHSVSTAHGSIVQSLEPGVACMTVPAGTPQTEYYHGDLIGTTRAMSDAQGTSFDPAVYTAFGELVGDSTNHRYGYAGRWGYQTHEDFPYLHVGARYYDPATGRFLQRDPIGVVGGLNVYAYLANAPTASIDPKGLQTQKVGSCQDECDVWYPTIGGACGGREAFQDCYASCNDFYWPPAPARQPPPPGFTPWPGPCPPTQTPSTPGGPSPSGGGSRTSHIMAFFLVLLIALISSRAVRLRGLMEGR